MIILLKLNNGDVETGVNGAVGLVVFATLTVGITPDSLP
jgi:hypothetical protein